MPFAARSNEPQAQNMAACTRPSRVSESVLSLIVFLLWFAFERKFEQSFTLALIERMFRLTRIGQSKTECRFTSVSQHPANRATAIEKRAVIAPCGDHECYFRVCQTG